MVRFYKGRFWPLSNHLRWLAPISDCCTTLDITLVQLFLKLTIEYVFEMYYLYRYTIVYLKKNCWLYRSCLFACTPQ
jgi:hypothetical protein